MDESLDDTVKLLFDLSSADRLTLLPEIRKNEKQRLTRLAEKIRATIQETSRHIGRLNEAKLIEKDSDGYHILTSYGRLALLLLSSFDFLRIGITFSCMIYRPFHKNLRKGLASCLTMNLQ